MGVTAGCTVLHYVPPAANFYPSALPRFWRNHLFIRDVGHPVETAGTLHLTSLQSQPISLFNLNKTGGSVISLFFLQRISDTFITIHHVISHIWLFNKNGHSPGLHKLWFSWLGKPLFEMCWFYIGIAQIDLDPPFLLSNGQIWKRSAPNHPGKPLHPASFGQWTMHFCYRKAKNSCCSENLDLQHF